MKRADAESDSVLARIISTVGSTLELDEVLRAVVGLLSEASAVHACFVYLVDDDGGRLVLRAAGEPYEQLIGEISLARGEGLAWWAAERREPAFIRENLLADPRTKYVPELEEERFQSLLCVPIAARDGGVIGVISAHTEAPREFTQAEVDFLVTSASLVAGAIENARLYEEMRTRVRELETITGLAETIAHARTIDELVVEVTARSLELLGARACHVYLLEPGSEELSLRASTPSAAPARATLGLSELGPELARGGRASRVAVPLIAGDELLGLLIGEGSASVDLARAVASQTAVGIKKIQLIERLTEKNLIKDFFEDLAAGRSGGDVEGRAARLGFDLELPYLVLAADPADDELEPALAALLPGSLFDRRGNALRALLRVHPAGPERAVEGVRRAHAALADARRDRPLEHLQRHRHASARASRRPARRCSAPPSSSARRRCSASTTSARTSTSCGSHSTAASVTPRSTPCPTSPTTTLRAAPRCSGRSRSSCTGAATSAPPPRRSTSIRTPCGSGCAGSASSRGSTSAATTG